MAKTLFVDSIVARLERSKAEADNFEPNTTVIKASLEDVQTLLDWRTEDDVTQQKLEQAIREWFGKHKIYNHDHTFNDILLRFMEQADRTILGAESSYKRLVDDMLIYLRALAIIAETVGNSQTHSEKAARTRGLIEALESAISRLQNEQFKIVDRYWASTPDLFRSDYPVREYKERVYRLEEELEALKKSQNGHSDPQPEEDIPL